MRCSSAPSSRSAHVGIFNLQGLVLFALYVVGVVGALLVAFVLKRTMMRGEYHPLLLELPEYHWPHLRIWRSGCGSARGSS